MTSQSYYDILGVECTASPTEIKRAYNSLALQTHPDKLLHSNSTTLLPSSSSSSSSSSSYNSNSNSNSNLYPESESVEPFESISECKNIKATKKPKPNPNISFHMIHVAYKTLIDSTSRRKYDAEISASGSMGTPHIVIDLDDMVYSVTKKNSRDGEGDEEEGSGGESGDGGNGVYGYPCRCGDDITISEDELERGVEIVECTGCSLRAKIVYFVVED